jgi:hypothetical protein
MFQDRKFGRTGPAIILAAQLFFSKFALLPAFAATYVTNPSV